ncbi:MAG: outer membrane beta-barrel protein [Planctomycetaceae bacterium]
MLKFNWCTRTLAVALGLGWASSAYAQPAAAPTTPNAVFASADQGDLAPIDYAPPMTASTDGIPECQPTYQVGYTQTCDCPKCRREARRQAKACQDGGCQLTSGWFESIENWEGFDLGESLFGEDSAYDIGGWLQSGYHSRPSSGPPSAGFGTFNNHKARWGAHQAWLFAEKSVDGSEGLDFGYRADFMYGLDAADTQAFGGRPGSWDFQNGFDHGQFGFAIPQLYGEVAYGDLSVKFGHFFTLVGYEVVTAPDNFFYSHSFTMYNSEPFTHSGALATYQATDNVTIYGGWTAGWDTGFDSFHDGDSTHGSNFLGGISYGLTDDVTMTYITTIGDFGVRGEGYAHSIVLDVALTDDLQYVFQSDFVDTNTPGDIQVGVNQYLFYTINDYLKAGVRGEWWQSGAVTGANGGFGTASFNEVTMGLNIKAKANFVLRPEVRHQWSPYVSQNGAAVPGLTPFFGRTIFGIDAIMTF